MALRRQLSQLGGFTQRGSHAVQHNRPVEADQPRTIGQPPSLSGRMACSASMVPASL